MQESGRRSIVALAFNDMFRTQQPSSTLLFLVVLLTPTSHAFDVRVGAKLVEWLEWRENGELFVQEEGVRLDAGLQHELAASGKLRLTYDGALYASLVRHRGWDTSFVTIPSGYESMINLGQAGTSQFLDARYKLGVRSVSFEPSAGVGIDSWYRPLDYYEIWFVPIIRYGITFSDMRARRWHLFIGANSIVEARQRTQTTNPPWNADRNITQKIDGKTSLALTLTVLVGSASHAGLGFAEYRFGPSDITVLRPGFGIYQPASRFRYLECFIRRRF